MTPFQAGMRIALMCLGLGASITVVVVVARRWGRMLYHDRMFALSYAALVAAPVVGVVERYRNDAGFYWADYVILVAIIWMLIGLYSGLQSEKKVHDCPNCGYTHPVDLNRIPIPTPHPDPVEKNDDHE